MKRSYFQTLWPETVGDVGGFSYVVTLDGEEIFGGWTPGAKEAAKDEILERLRKRENHGDIS